MGTSTAFGGQGGGTPLVPSWVDENDSPTSPSGADQSDGSPPFSSGKEASSNQPSTRPSIPPVADRSRFKSARSNFSRFANSGGDDRRSLGRAVSRYVSSSAGGARAAAARMGASRGAGGRLVSFLSDTMARGATEALRSLNLDSLAGRPIEEVFLGLADYVCPDGGSIDEGIARDAFIETITGLADEGITDLDGLSAEQMQTVFELYATNAIEARLCNDIGANTVTLPTNSREAASVQAQLNDFIRRGVADALNSAGEAPESLTPDRVFEFVEGVYEQAFGILQLMGDAEAEAV